MSLREAREKALVKHNQLRALHHDIPSMVLSDDLNDQAQAWANHLVKIGSMNHSTSSQRPNQGENLSWKMDSRGVSLEAAAIGACESWYNEIKDFDWINYRNHTDVVGHFTQVSHSIKQRECLLILADMERLNRAWNWYSYYFN
jgi:hypothetical protein